MDDVIVFETMAGIATSVDPPNELEYRFLTDTSVGFF
jgi:hypothetical protein